MLPPHNSEAKSAGADEAHYGEEWFRLLVEGAAEYAMFLVSPDGVIASWNEGARQCCRTTIRYGKTSRGLRSPRPVIQTVFRGLPPSTKSQAAISREVLTPTIYLEQTLIHSAGGGGA